MSASTSWSPWTLADDEALRTIYTDLSIKSPAKHASEKLGRSMAAISFRAFKLKITRTQLKRIALAASAAAEEKPAAAIAAATNLTRWQPRPKRPLETVPDFLRDDFTEFARRRPAS